MNLHERCEKIRAVVLDVDGVLTDGRIGSGAGSEEEIKFFFVRDGLGITLARKCGLKVGILSGRESGANRRRAEELKLDFIPFPMTVSKLTSDEMVLDARDPESKIVMFSYEFEKVK